MVNLLSPPFWTPVDGNGNIYAGAFANFYRTGTTTRQDTYADYGLTTPNANPVEADANGAFAPIYLSADYDYKLILTTAAGAIIKTIDPVPLQSFQTTVVLNGSELDVMPYAPPMGRLTLQTAEPVMLANYAAKTTLYYTPYVGNLVPIWDGANFVPTTFAELSNILTNSATGKAGPAVAGAYQNIDAFVWNDAGTVRLTRGPKWVKTATVTMTIAIPGVVTWTAHGLYDGATVVFSTTGALPTGVTAGTTYFVRVIDANTFNLCTTIANQIAGTYITTSGSQSGVHTAENYTISRGVDAAASTTLERYQGIWVNKYDITNGPLARKGTYVGTIYCDSASQANWHVGAVASLGTEAKLHVWNAYNRVNVEGHIGDTTDSWNYSTATARPSDNSPTMRATFLAGLQEEFFWGEHANQTTNGSQQTLAYAGIGYDSTTAFSGRYSGNANPVGVGSGIFTAVGSHRVQAAVGLHYMQALELPNATGTTTWYGDAGGISQNGLVYRGRF
ncbi:hypothetical protein [uncultured Bradyrhizobium sp.]|uniref:hypothetical protein n=1 Tax=uncultured Bradyrhizobium sp. TaxID=199684 RepID=UPI00261587A0|nr:hypothetical protein [uncultured Bradyrhizobium sp.]